MVRKGWAVTRLGVGEAAHGSGILLAQTFHVSNAVFELVFNLSQTKFQLVLYQTNTLGWSSAQSSVRVRSDIDTGWLGQRDTARAL